MMLSWARIEKREVDTNIDSLPDDLLIVILVCFPAVFLHDRARLVCRRWCRIIRSHAFINTYIQHHSTYGLVLSSPYWDPHAIYVKATQGQIETSEFMRTRRVIATSCNGLAVEYNARTLHVINPRTKQSFLLPSHDRSVGYFQTSIAYSAASMEYKVTQPYSDHCQPIFLDILTVGVDKSWRHVEIPPLPERLYPFNQYPLSSEGFLHWGKERYCLTLNVETEIMTLTEAPTPPPPLPPPYRFDQYSYYYMSTGRYITLLANHQKELSWEVWEMRPAESGEWRKPAVLSNIDLEAEKCSLKEQFGYNDRKHDLKPVGWVKYPEVLVLSFGRSVRTYIFYNLETLEFNARKIELTCNDSHHNYRALVHRNSLVWLTQD